MVRYEILLLAVPHVTQEEEKNIEKGLDALIRQAKGTIISVDRWGKCRLAYQVRKQDYGLYILVRFELEAISHELLAEVKQLLSVKYNELIMRHTVVRLAEGQKLDYKRPLSVEEAPSRGVDSLIHGDKNDSDSFNDDAREMDRNHMSNEQFDDAQA